MNPMLEKAARAACVADGHNPDGPVCDIYIHDDPDAGKPWAGYRNIAKAVLLAVREPDEGMVEAACDAYANGNPDECPSPSGMADAHRAAIDYLASTGEPS